MIGLYCSTPRLLTRVRRLLPNNVQVAVTHDCLLADVLRPAPACWVIIAPWLFASHERTLIRGLCTRFPLAGMVLVITRDADNARLVRDLPVHELIWLQDLEKELWPAVQRAIEARRVEHVAHDVETAPHIPVILRRALAFALRSSGSCTRVRDLTIAVGCDRRMLWRRWRETYGPTPALRLEDVLGWVILLRAAGAKVPGRGWASVASELGVHEHTLARLAQRLAGRTLRGLAAEGPESLWALFESRVGVPLLNATCWGDARHPAVAQELAVNQS